VTENKNYQMSETPIADKSLLGTLGQNLCNNIDVHWMTPGQRASECGLFSYG